MVNIPGLKSEYEEIKPVKEKTVPEYIHSSKGKTLCGWGKKGILVGSIFSKVDGLTDEKRYFHTLDEETRKVASAFSKLGLQKDDVVIYMIKDLCKIHLLFLGVWRANGILRASYPDDDAETILARVKESKCRFIVCEDDTLDVCQEVGKSIDWTLNIIMVNRKEKVGVSSLQQFLEKDNGADCPKLLITENDPAIILCTSGTTGLPKGAVHTHKGLLYTIRSSEPGPLLLHKPNLIAVRATHISAIMPLSVLATGKTSIVVSDLTKESIFQAVEKYSPGFVFAFPTFLLAMADAHGQGGRDFSSIEVLFTGGVSITPAIRQCLRKLPNLKDTALGYGLTEEFMCATSAVMLDDNDKKGILSIRDLPDFSVGKIMPGYQLQFRHPDTMEILGPNEHGEICVKSPGTFHSYLDNPEATENAFIDGYFRTGDVGYCDENGFIYIKGRLKETFKYHGNHISPTEIENVIGKHPNVGEVCVVGIANGSGHVPRAFVRLNANLKEKMGIAREIQEFANAKLAEYKQLRGGVYVMDELPKGKTGKVSRLILEQLDVLNM